MISSLAIDDVEPPRRAATPTLGSAVAEARELLEAENATLEPARDARLAGEPASVTDATTAGGARVRQLVAVHEGEIYTVTLVAAARAFEERAAAYDRVVSSWRWG